MRWLVRRVLALWLIMLVLCGTVALLVRLNREPGPLQALGFDVCDGEPCWRGIKMGMALTEVQEQIPEGIYSGQYFTVPLNLAGNHHVILQSIEGGKILQLYIHGSSGLMHPTYPITPGQMIAIYGMPCRVDFVEVNDNLFSFEIWYPRMVARYGNATDPTQLDSRIQLDISAYEFWIYDEIGDVCHEIAPTIGRWHGFASSKVYLARNRRALSVK
jgi:hypothetical protein